jgi:ABC-type uncharacterized transport system substrate-binding protein
MNRREFIAGLGSAIVWPITTHAQQANRISLLAFFRGASDDTPGERERYAAFVGRLGQLGWIEGQNLRIEKRYADGDDNKMQAFAKELVALRPDVIQVAPSPAVAAILSQTKTIPIVFTVVADPVEVGFVKSLARPTGNVTGFTLYEHGIGSKWLALLKEIAPQIARVVIMHSPVGFSMRSYVAPIEVAAREIGIDCVTAVVGSESQIDASVEEIGNRGDGGLIVLPDTYTITHRQIVLSAVTRRKVPAIYPIPELWAKEGGLISYGPDLSAMTIAAASYVDRILRGQSPGDLPVQQPERYPMVINLKTAKALALTVPPTLLARADEVIE